MMRASVRRLARMGPAELLWRVATAGRTSHERLRCAMAIPAWDRTALRRVLGRSPELAPIRAAASNSDWSGAQTLLGRYFHEGSSRFPISPTQRTAVAARVRAEFPAAAADA